MEPAPNVFIPLVLRFTADTQETASVTTQLQIDSDSFLLLPILHGKLNPMWNQGQIPQKIQIDLSKFQKENSEFPLSVQEVQFILRTIQYVLLYGKSLQEYLLLQMTNLYSEMCAIRVLDFEHMYVTLHFLMPERANILMETLFIILKEACKVECFSCKRKVNHKEMAKWLRRFLCSYFSLATPLHQLSFLKLNLISAWSLIRNFFDLQFRTEILHLDTLKMSDRAVPIMHEFLSVYNRMEAHNLVESLTGRISKRKSVTVPH